ncbi:Peptide methionine sulfoxide reductase MsrA [Piscirickettsia salmonis]|uniref:Peptide methionine sulfoxide reductase MsrA n=1 Tax=Piscirickettsia salmonis TaxID=1238 RepID=A0A1L6TFA2_PISSA|nr:peptide-methionine (S)-S-oxide reductase MsrA [Piscirickettsia salmonis]AKP72418.1 methionine sulfoxide reductase A [Piscirickettsia salmonis LF-89 = ATCC VR-1361]ALB24124.1 peptide-methionine (S)-S-oxide reductase [Piscirickettsia salmonis]ALY03931.1 methionine sulfoxide reductase A [Piscirickettsia salmonis]AMA43492.1 methionine sulfoxide reductase A [Piscirickettsia salmonis]AOS35961.1 methionine sulfoxide reductase A [Piscirickettsia salmonis]
MEKACFAAGCFWGVEASFRKLVGVIDTRVGYSGGHLANPSYDAVCSGQTGHAEAIEVDYDPAIISYLDLLNHFWQCHNPTTLNRQGPDEGSQYRSVIFYYSSAQHKCAEQSKAQQAVNFNEVIVTDIMPAGPFYLAEEYHQGYFEKRGEGGACFIR